MFQSSQELMLAVVVLPVLFITLGKRRGRMARAHTHKEKIMRTLEGDLLGFHTQPEPCGCVGLCFGGVRRGETRESLVKIAKVRGAEWEGSCL